MAEMRDFAREAWEAATHRHHQPPHPAIPDIPAIPATQEEHPMPVASAMHHDLDTVLHVLPAIASTIGAVAANPKADELLEAILEAAGLGVEAEAFAVVTAGLRDASARKRAQAQPQAAPAAAGPMAS